MAADGVGKIRKITADGIRLPHLFSSPGISAAAPSDFAGAACGKIGGTDAFGALYPCGDFPLSSRVPAHKAYDTENPVHNHRNPDADRAIAKVHANDIAEQYPE